MITKKQFNKLQVDKQVACINNLLSKDISFKNACKIIDVSRNTIKSKFEKAGFVFDEKLHMYYKNNNKKVNKNCKNSTKIIDYKDNIKIIDNYKNNADVIDKNYKDDIKVIEQVKELIPHVKEMLKWYKLQKNKENIIDAEPIAIDMNKKEFKGAAGTHSIKCYETIYDNFIMLCKDYPAYKRQDMISLALLEFVKKYKK